MTTSEQVPYQERDQSWCLSFPPRCTKYKIKFRTVNKTQALPKTRTVKYCCDGYGRNLAGDRCIPICSECKHGECIAPDVCKCNHGYGGPGCDISE